jgi:hypothetical protein
MMSYRTIALASVLLVALSGCGVNSTSPGSTGGAETTATSAGSSQTGKTFTAKVAAQWAPIINSYIDVRPIPDLLNAASLDGCMSVKKPTTECGAAGPLRDTELEIMCRVEGPAGIVGVFIPPSALLHPERLLYKSTPENRDVGFTNIQYLDRSEQLVAGLNALREAPGGSTCSTLTHKI